MLCVLWFFNQPASTFKASALAGSATLHGLGGPGTGNPGPPGGQCQPPLGIWHFSNWLTITSMNIGGTEFRASATAPQSLGNSKMAKVNRNSSSLATSTSVSFCFSHRRTNLVTCGFNDPSGNIVFTSRVDHIGFKICECLHAWVHSDRFPRFHNLIASIWFSLVYCFTGKLRKCRFISGNFQKRLSPDCHSWVYSEF